MQDKLTSLLDEVLTENGKKLKSNVELSTSLRSDLEFDSLDLAVLTVKIEDEFDIDIFEDGIVDTVSEIMTKLKKVN